MCAVMKQPVLRKLVSHPMLWPACRRLFFTTPSAVQFFRGPL